MCDPGWILTKDKLPPVQEWVLVTRREAKDVTVMRTWDAGLPNSIWWEDKYDDLTDLEQVVAWMPLPKGYEGGDANEGCCGVA